MQTTFFATASDISDLWRLLYDTPDIRIVEEYSAPGLSNRWFDNWDAVAAALTADVSLSAWPESVGDRPIAEKIERGRTALLSPAFIKVHRNADQRGCLAASYMSCWSERGAAERSISPPSQIRGMDWKAFRSIVGKLNRQLRKSAPARLRSYPILPDAFDKLSAGEISLWNWGSPCDYPSDLIVVT